MISVEDRGSTRSGRVYLPNFIDRVPDSRRLEVIQNLANLHAVDVNSLSTMMENLSITAKAAGPSKTLGEYGTPSTLVAKNPIVYPDVKGTEYEIDPELLIMMQDNAFSGEEHEDPSVHLTRVNDICELVGPRNLPKDFLLLKLFRWGLKDKAFKWLQALPRNTISSLKDCIKEFMNRFNPFYKTMQVKREITNFFQNIGESFAQAWGRFSGLIMRVTNHGFMDHVILQYFYGGLNNEAEQMVDACAGGTLNSLTYKEAVKLFTERALNDEKYNPLGEVELKKGMLFITPELMPAVKKSMKEKGIPTKLAIESKTNELHAR